MGSMLLSVFVASLAGSLHCAGMCGGFVGFYAPGLEGSGRRRGHLAYNLGRLFAYMLLGFTAGYLGRAIDAAAAFVGLERVVSLVAGAVMVSWGLGVFWGRFVGWPMRRRTQPRPTQIGASKSWAARAFERVFAQPPVVRAGLIGLCTGLLPCGWLYAFVVAAAGTGSPTTGALVMLAFWAGTLPVLTGLGVLCQRGGQRLRRFAPLLGAGVMVAVGLFGIFHRVTSPAPATAGDLGSCHGHR